MKNLILSAAILSFVFATSCKKDDDNSGSDDGCQTCAAFDVEVNGETQTTPEVEVCEGENGNAFVAGQDTMQTFATYIAGLELFTTCN